MVKKFDPEHMINVAKELQNFVNTELVETSQYQEHKIQLKADKQMKTGVFKAHPFLVDTWMANPVTIEAMRHDLFMVGDGFEDFELLYTCEGCQQTVDVQFWKRCPHCSKSFPREFDNPKFNPMPWEKKNLIQNKTD